MRESQKIEKQKNGFTLLNMMIALVVFTFLAALVSNMAMTTLRPHQYDTLDRKDIWLFFSQINDELSSGEQFNISEDDINFQLYGDIVDYKRIGTTIRRQLNGDGYEIVLQNINQFTITDQNQRIMIDLTDTNGRPYRWTIKKMIQ